MCPVDSKSLLVAAAVFSVAISMIVIFIVALTDVAPRAKQFLVYCNSRMTIESVCWCSER
jgi:hypothetical protein